MRGVTKRIFLNALECKTLGWFLRSTDDSGPLSLADRFRMEQGSQIGTLSRTLYPDGIHVAPGTGAAERTARLMADPKTQVLFEATFVVGESTARADVLDRTESGWKVVEVKSSLEDTDRMDELVADLTYTVVAARRAGATVSAASLLLLSREYRKSMPISKLFTEVDQTEAVEEFTPPLEAVWEDIERATGAPEKPAPALIKACKECSFFATACHGAGVVHPVFEIPRLHEKKLADLSSLGILEIEELPDGFALTPAQARVVDAVRTNRAFIGALRRQLDAVTWPASYLDFESTQTAIPLYSELAPFEQIPTQYSIHRCSGPGRVDAHADYLADPARDCRRELAEQLIRDLRTAGSVIVYSSFEKTRIRALARKFPDLAPQLEAIQARLFDLLSVVQKEYYHPAFRGSASIKNVLPVLVPELSYDGMEIGDGDAASAVFALIAMGKHGEEESGRLLELLRAYCRQDTLAMVKLHAALLTVW
ncbi:MAG TPA: DUF2779 domain-containing protein [Planctomycetota bacterium]|nr:DUF2779 domain-containing protein [Planctomycetota bacterium]